MENNTYEFGKNAQLSKQLKIASCFNNDLAKSEVGYAFGNSNPDMNSLKFSKKGSELIKMISEKKTSLDEKHTELIAQIAATKAILTEQGFTFKVDVYDNTERVEYNYDTHTDEQRKLCYTFNDLVWSCKRLKDEIKTCQALIDNLEENKTYNLSTPQVLSLQKALEFDIEKGGEGSKGGKVIGHTKSGKPIYNKNDHKSHSNFTQEEHSEAAKVFANHKGKKHVAEGYKSGTDSEHKTDEDHKKAGYIKHNGVWIKPHKDNVEKADTESTPGKETVEKSQSKDLQKALEVLGV